MKEKINISRIQSLLYRFWVEKKLNLIVTGVITLSVFVLVNLTSLDVENKRNGIKFFEMIILGKWLFLGILIYHLHVSFSKGSGSVKSRFMHLLPATSAEKYSYLILSAFVLPILFYFVAFEIINSIFALSMLSRSFSFLQFLFVEISFMNQQLGGEAIRLFVVLFSILMYYLMLQLFIWGLIRFKDYAVLKVFAMVYLSTNVFGLVVFQLLNPTFGPDIKNSLQALSTENPDRFIQLSWLMFVVIFTLLSMLFYVSYLKFKNKELKA